MTGVPTGAIVAGAVKRAQDTVLERLKQANATHPSRATALDGLGGMESRMLARFVSDGVVRKTPELRYYLDEAQLGRHKARQAERARMGFLVAVLIVIVALAIAALNLATP